MTLHFLRPQQVAGYPITYHQSDPEIGGIDVYVWRTQARDEGLAVHCTDWAAVHRLVDAIRTAQEGAQ